MVCSKSNSLNIYQSGGLLLDLFYTSIFMVSSLITSGIKLSKQKYFCFGSAPAGIAGIGITSDWKIGVYVFYGPKLSHVLLAAAIAISGSPLIT